MRLQTRSHRSKKSKKRLIYKLSYAERKQFKRKTALSFNKMQPRESLKKKTKSRNNSS